MPAGGSLAFDLRTLRMIIEKKIATNPKPPMSRTTKTNVPSLIERFSARANAFPRKDNQVTRIRIGAFISVRKKVSGRASPCQGEGREFESRLPLHVHIRQLISCRTHILQDSPLFTIPKDSLKKRAKAERPMNSTRNSLR